ncbi:MAG: glycosyltransferase [Cocleimonas sp.]
MKTTIITPSLNQSRFLLATLSSIANQKGCEIEHLIIDPGSTDGSLDLIKIYVKNHSWAKAIIGKDKSQTNAINIGFTQASGDILCWLNSDDRYTHDFVIRDIVETFENNPSVDVIYCRGSFIEVNGKKIKDAFVHPDGSVLKHTLMTSIGILQPALFMRKSAFRKAGDLDESMHFSFDYEYWLRLLRTDCTFMHLPNIVAEAVIHDDAKTIRDRSTSLSDCMKVANRYFGFTPYEWIERYIDNRETGADGILSSSTAKNLELPQKVMEEFLKRNQTRESQSNILSYAEFKECDKSLEQLRLTLNCNLWLVTAFDQAYFSAGLTLLSGLCKQGYEDAPKLIFDIGLSEAQRTTLLAIKNTFIISFNTEQHDLPEWYLKPKSYVYKLLAMQHMQSIAKQGETVLWIDAGVYPIKSLTSIEKIIENQGCFFIDHDDRPASPLYNIIFTSEKCSSALNATVEELLALHVCSCLMGFKMGHPQVEIFQQAFLYSLNADASLGEKQPVKPELKGPLSKQIIADKRTELFESNVFPANISDLQDVFGYWGHRQDQSIISLLATRHKATISSAKTYCVGSDESSEASKLNWNSGSFSSSVNVELNAFSKFPDSVTLHHRGTIVSFENLKWSFNKSSDEAMILGNGPSLRGFDFKRFSRFDTFGMNAAYRYWYEINWFPDYYSCLDLVVGISHIEEITKLISNADKLGIKAFLLRDGLIEKLGETGQNPKVINFDLLRQGYETWQTEPITTGSHTCAWASILGYKNIYLHGIDCDYVELVSTAESREGNVLEIVKDGDDSNYFFDGYQKAGDQYNIPNPAKDLHIRSWRNIAEKIKKSYVINANTKSKVDAFPIIDFDEIYGVKDIEKPTLKTLETKKKPPEKPLAPSPTLRIKDANKLYQQGNYTEAIEMYWQLYQLRPLKMYISNALMAAKKQGIESVETEDDLISYFAKQNK